MGVGVGVTRDGGMACGMCDRSPGCSGFTRQAPWLGRRTGEPWAGTPSTTVSTCAHQLPLGSESSPVKSLHALVGMSSLGLPRTASLLAPLPQRDVLKWTSGCPHEVVEMADGRADTGLDTALESGSQPLNHFLGDPSVSPNPSVHVWGAVRWAQTHNIL